MDNKIYKPPRWITTLLAAEAHKELTVIALDAEITLAKLGKAIFKSFLEGDKEWQSQVISKAKALE